MCLNTDIIYTMQDPAGQMLVSVENNINEIFLRPEALNNMNIADMGVVSHIAREL